MALVHYDRVVQVMTQPVEESFFAHTGSAVASAHFRMNTHIATVLDIRPTATGREASEVTVLSQEQATDIYHCIGQPAELIPSVIPEGAQVGSLFKIACYDTSKRFNFFCKYLNREQWSRISGLVRGIVST
jgi:hypothetical protein